MVANQNANTISVLLGNGDGTFGTKIDFGTGNVPYSVAIGDANGDLKPDLVTADSYSNTVSVLLNVGSQGPSLGACCHFDGTCTITQETDCPAPGTWQGPGIACTPNPCPQPPTGACCNPITGACTVTTQVNCQAPNTWQGPNTACTPNPCPFPTGACCAPGGPCHVLTQAQCQLQTGDWQGPFTTCDPDPCVGACCLNFRCRIHTGPDCAGYGGTYLGDGTLCDPDPCSQTSSVERRLGNLALRNIVAVPNPSTGQVLILYRVSRAADVTLEIFDAPGAVVRRLAQGQQPAGVHVTHWDGRSDAGQRLPSGSYFTRIETAAGVVTGRVVLTR